RSATFRSGIMNAPTARPTSSVGSTGCSSSAWSCSRRRNSNLSDCRRAEPASESHAPRPQCPTAASLAADCRQPPVLPVHEPEPTVAAIDRHNEEIQENRRHWDRKPQLRRQYERFYRRIASALEGIPAGPVLECGSGIGNLKSVLPDAITSDLFPNPWL